MSTRERKCPDCGGTRFVEDHAQGDIVCKGCGLVVEAHIIDERSEWRTFSDKDKETADPNRVGGPNNPLLDGGGLSTMIAKEHGGSNLNRLHTRSNNPDKALLAAFKQLGELAEKLKLTGGSAKNLACEHYKDAMSSGRLKGRSSLAVSAACLYLACRSTTTPRSFKEITAIMPPSVRKKDISACFKEILAMHKDKNKGKDPALMQMMAPVAQHPADYMKRFVNELRLGREVMLACQDMAYAAKPKEEDENAEHRPWDARSPLSVAAAILWIITTIKAPVGLPAVVVVTNVAEATIRIAYKDLYPHLSKLLPAGFNNPDQIAKLPVPEGRPSIAAITGGSGGMR